MSARWSWAWVGFAAGPLCWFGQQQLLYWLQPVGCRGRGWLEPVIAVVFIVVLALAVAAAFRTLLDLPAGGGAPKSLQRAYFVAVLGTLMPLIFLVAMLWQGAASFVYGPCE